MPQNNFPKVLSFPFYIYFRQFLASKHIIRSHNEVPPAASIHLRTFFGFATHLCSKAGLILLHNSTGISKTSFLRLSISLFIQF